MAEGDKAGRGSSGRADESDGDPLRPPEADPRRTRWAPPGTRRDATAPHDSVISVHVGDGVDEAYEEAKRRGYEIVHPLTEEAWGLRRFLVRAPDGNVINVVSHRDD